MSASGLLTSEGRDALADASAEPDPGSLAAATRLRRRYSAEVAAAALNQAALRRKARAKFGERANELFFTSAGLEQASRPEVASWRARRLIESGVSHVVDLGCGIGADARAMLDAGIAITAVEIDPVTAEFAAANLPEARVLVGDVELIADQVLAAAPPDAAVFLDPARRTAAGRTWRVADVRPRWDLVMRLVAQRRCVVKLGPGVPKEILPSGVQTCWVSHRGDVVEAGLWSPGGGSCAVLLPVGATLGSGDDEFELPVGEVGRYLYEPNGAVIRAGLLNRIDPRLRLLDPHVAYLASDDVVESPFVTGFEVCEQLPFEITALKKWVAVHDVGTLEIKKRAIDIDPAELRRRLKPRGRSAATLVVARTNAGTRVLVARRMSP